MAFSLFTLANAVFSGLFAGAVSVLVTFLVEKLGPLGALLGTTPTTIIPASIGFAMANFSNPHFENSFVITLYSTIPGMLINCLYLQSVRLFARQTFFRNFWLRFCFCVGGGLLVWLCSTIIFVSYKWVALDRIFTTPASLQTALVIVGIASYVTQLGMGLALCYNMAPKVVQAKTSSSYKELILRIVLRGSFTCIIIAISVALSQVNNFLAGVASVFPAIFTTTLVSMFISNGEEFAVNAVPSLILGSTSVSMYCIICAWTMLQWGIVGGLLFSYTCAVVINTIPCYVYIQWRTRVANAQQLVETSSNK